MRIREGAGSRPVDCDCPLGESRSATWRPTLYALTPTSLVTVAVAAPVTGSLVGAALFTALTTALATGVVAGVGRLPHDVRKRVRERRERDRAATSPETCASREHASVAVRVRRAAWEAEHALTSHPYLAPSKSTGYDALTKAEGALTRALIRLGRGVTHLESLGAGDAARLLALLEDHLPTSLRLFSELPESVRRARRADSARDLLAVQLDGFARDVFDAAVRLDVARHLAERDADRDLAEHGRFLAADRASRTAAIEATGGTLDLTAYRGAGS